MNVRSGSIVLQKSKVAAVQIFGENLKRKDVDDSHSLSRATEVAHKFGARRDAYQHRMEHDLLDQDSCIQLT